MASCDGNGRGRAAVAAALELQPGNAVEDTEVLDAARVRAQVGPHPVQRALDAGVHVQRMEPVQQQQALHQRVIGELRQHLRTRLALLPQDGHDLAEAVSVQADEQPDEFLSRRSRRAEAAGLQRVE